MRTSYVGWKVYNSFGLTEVPFLAVPWLEVLIELHLIRVGGEVAAPVGTVEELLPQIDRSRMVDELLSCQAATGHLSPTGARNLLDPERHPKVLRGRSLAFIHSYLDLIHERKQIANGQDARWQNLRARVQEAMATFPARRPGVSQTGNRSLARSKFFEYTFDKIAESSEERDIFVSHMFNMHDAVNLASYANTTYYVGFRYSTLEGRILKSFLAVLSPAENKLGFFSFAHVAKGDARYSDLKKVTKGLVLNLPPATYFLGRTLRDDAATVSNFEMMTIERDTFLANRPVLHALLMSSAALNQPIVSRMVLVRVGDRLTLKKKLSDAELKPVEFDDGELANQVKDLLGICADIGAPIPLKTTNSRTLIEQRGALEALIREGINNIPRPALVRAVRENLRSRKKRPTPISDGAIEVWGQEPRP